jgi:hypothetical protein
MNTMKTRETTKKDGADISDQYTVYSVTTAIRNMHDKPAIRFIRQVFPPPIKILFEEKA